MDEKAVDVVLANAMKLVGDIVLLVDSCGAMR